MAEKCGFKHGHRVCVRERGHRGSHCTSSELDQLAEITGGPVVTPRGVEQLRSNVVRPSQFRQPVRGYAVEGARLQVPADTRCVVNVSRCVGLDEHGFCVVDGAAALELHFCARHALAAEALVTYAGLRGSVVPKLLALLDCGELDDLPEIREREPLGEIK